MRHKLVLIGCGGMAKSHASRFESLEDRMEVSAVVDIEKERAENVSALLPNHPPVFTDYRQALPMGDLVLQVLPHHLHASCTIECLNAGKHVLAEKPLANSREECLAMMEAAKRNNRILMVAYCMRFHPILREMRRLIHEQVYGKCFQLSIWTEQLTTMERFSGSWAHDRRLLGGGQLFSHGCHYIDLMLWMMGRPVKGTHIGTKIGTPWMDREGTSNVCLEFEDGTLGYHFGTWGARGTRMGYSFQAHCEKGLLDFKLSENQLFFRGRMEEHVPGASAKSQDIVLMDLGTAPPKPTAEEMRHFIDCVDGATVPETTPEESLAGLEVIWELYRAEEEGRLADFSGIDMSAFEKKWHE
ncbi:MAG: Gfo/Idh/MocA family oxidoreductase [Victivallales bacterium]|nr:Gfo/Idh/MocA family oxidoreductase [Victivallales bacterium]